ncbi:HAD family hydrolase [Novosphingobium sp. 9]|uniref:HAD family hydrolase n=1 Tax=Novosphingobium sp. 9 TaxID=2025349 RepID=UPI0021B5765E|nr:HAD family hydrolase [Novosphingobium sp. 9]
MSRPLIITDCDEVLLHMVAHFRDWLAESQGVEFRMKHNDFTDSMTWIDGGGTVPAADVWRLLNAFFDTEMARQTAVKGAIEGITELQRHADVVVLTNLLDFRRNSRKAQLAAFGLDLPIYTNQGPKGPALKAILDEYQPERAIFIDDLSQHHGSVAEVTPHVTRLHLCAEPVLAPHIACAFKAGHAHARIDDWAEALPWLLAKLNDDQKDFADS